MGKTATMLMRVFDACRDTSMDINTSIYVFTYTDAHAKELCRRFIQLLKDKRSDYKVIGIKSLYFRYFIKFMGIKNERRETEGRLNTLIYYDNSVTDTYGSSIVRHDKKRSISRGKENNEN